MAHCVSGSVKHPQRDVSRKMVRVWPSGEVVHTDCRRGRVQRVLEATSPGEMEDSF